MKILAAAIFIFSVVLSPKVPGVNCEESEGSGPEEDSFDGFVYTVDIQRTGLTVSSGNDFLSIFYTGGEPSATFFQTMDVDNPLLAEFFIFVDDDVMYESSEEQMLNVCDHSYPEGSVEANFVNVISLEMMDGKGCPVEKGKYKLPKWMNGTELKFNNPIPCGEYQLITNLNTSENKWVVQFDFDFTIKNGDTECTEEKNPF